MRTAEKRRATPLFAIVSWLPSSADAPAWRRRSGHLSEVPIRLFADHDARQLGESAAARRAGRRPGSHGEIAPAGPVLLVRLGVVKPQFDHAIITLAGHDIVP